MATLGVYDIPIPEPAPNHLRANSNNELVDILKAHADLLLIRHMTTTPELRDANIQIKQIIDLLTERCENESKVLKGHIKFSETQLIEARNKFLELQKIYNHVMAELGKLNRRAELLAGQNDKLWADKTDLQGQVRNLQIERDDQTNRFRIIRNNLQGRVNRLTGERDMANNNLRVAQFTTRFLGRTRTRLLRQIAALRIQANWFRIRHNPPPVNPQPQLPITWLLLH